MKSARADAITRPRASFTRMDESCSADWEIIKTEVWRGQPQVAERVLSMLHALEDVWDGFQVNQLTHALQTATRAEEAGAGEELVVAALVHDIGKAISVYGHAQISAAILRPYVSHETWWAIDNHTVLQWRHYASVFSVDGERWKKLADHPAFERMRVLVDEWDQNSFDPAYPTRDLAHFEPLVRDVFGKPRGSAG